MATYQFSFITSEEARNYDAARDDLKFDGVHGATATNIEVLGHYTIRIISTGAKVTLGQWAEGDILTLPDGSKLSLPSSLKDVVTGGSAGDRLYGGVGDDLLNGAGGDDILDGGAGQDVLTGGAGADTLTGGAGADRFDFMPTDSGVAAGRIDVITDWDSLDRISISAPITGAYSTATAASYDEALGLANQRIAAGTSDIVAVQVGGDVILFVDSLNDNGVADDAIRLANKGLSQISGAHILSFGAPLPTPGEPPPTGPTTDPTAGADTLTAPYSGGELFGGLGADSLVGGGAYNRLDGGDGPDTISSRGTRDTILGGAGNDVIQFSGDTSEVRLGAGSDLILMDGYQQLESEALRVLDWVAYEDAIRFVHMGPGRYGEGAAADYDAARALANRMARDGYAVVSVRVGPDVFVFGHWTGVRFDSSVRLVDRTLDDISEVNLGILPATLPTAPAAAPPAPARATTGQVTVAGDMDAVDLRALDLDSVREVSLSRIVFDSPRLHITMTGLGFSTDATREVLYGDVTGFTLSANQGAPLRMEASVAPKSLSIIGGFDGSDARSLMAYMMSGSDRILGSSGPDRIRAHTGDDVVIGGGGGDQIFGGSGDDVIYAAGPDSRDSSQTYLRGDEGNDWIAGSDGFDDINGNMGNDTASGGRGDDWVVGGKDNDLLFGDEGDDLVYGNIGNDDCYGGAGADTLRGGQDNDRLFGGDGDDFLSGDRGADTLVGGAGADLFHSFVGAELDRIEDFNAAEGDRLMLSGGAAYTVEQVGPDTVVNLVGGGRVLLIGVTASTLPEGWIFTV
ncbi:hypothetical protein [Phenylobacterium sp. SCN 70-31]|uniref:calcium-binding protein n=1 Tax=Phenylobacterium sp. SCN 70-31 TaxID=1660129 RepID=UPI00086DEBCC|nr:hypothetical protein [Phenylobacterium sp. SCN 70-31]ODT85662.1 MAG: hypothetical protein ABS78_19570 [Phenylobacterium sp. SCN 70-31]